MTDENKKEQTRWERLQHTYRLVVMNNETFEEVGSYHLSLLNVYIILSTIVVLVASLVVLAVVFTPVRQFIPGYGDVTERNELMELNRQIDSLEAMFQDYETYSEHIKNMLTDNVEYAPDPPEKIEITNNDTSSVERVEEDEILRQEVELDEVREKAQNARPASFSPQEIPLEQLYFTPPINGEISAGFMPDKKHLGVDVIAPKNTAVKAALDGWVVIAGWTVETGNTIGIQHANNIITFYKHNSDLLKEVGNFVRAGEAVAIIGNTGDLSDGPHLHFELWYKGNAVNPVDLINFN